MIKLSSVITCPCCGSEQSHAMKQERSLKHYSCVQCKTALIPKPGDCCIFCSFGSEPCPPEQEQRANLAIHNQQNSKHRACYAFKPQ